MVVVVLLAVVAPLVGVGAAVVVVVLVVGGAGEGVVGFISPDHPSGKFDPSMGLSSNCHKEEGKYYYY